jgi:YegS/Rv2252/BmrU family lipid kinase
MVKAPNVEKGILFIVNPASARGTTRRMWARARRELDDLGIEFTEHLTSRAGEAAQVARQALQSGTKRIIAVGGDGTLNEVVNGYLNEAGQAINLSASIGLLPSGTGSDFRRSIGLRTYGDALRISTGSSTRLFDVVRMEFGDQSGAALSRCFINVATFGLGGDTAALVNRWRDALPGWVGGRARFIAAAIGALKQYRLRPVTVELDGQRQMRIESHLLVVANGRFAGGGMMLAPHAELDDGLLDVVMTDRATRLDVIRELPRIAQGGYLNNPKVTETRAREVGIWSDEPLAIELDGEPAGYTPAHLIVLPAAVRFAI